MTLLDPENVICLTFSAFEIIAIRKNIIYFAPYSYVCKVLE